ncbi:hypothetical protein FA95DRAFT_1194730 [Auriscalpium vulgare]|uniref:Uncharacterized protein n=1 Tax=Auriscalpium vulgare TaxID=40419 RepID=A0ACB8R401_9AGAM|nr:hypothetical protein FA95DRAFT_1194730 [Auriscalpium vulgare]
MHLRDLAPLQPCLHVIRPSPLVWDGREHTQEVRLVVFLASIRRALTRFSSQRPLPASPHGSETQARPVSAWTAQVRRHALARPPCILTLLLAIHTNATPPPPQAHPPSTRGLQAVDIGGPAPVQLLWEAYERGAPPRHHRRCCGDRYVLASFQFHVEAHRALENAHDGRAVLFSSPALSSVGLSLGSVQHPLIRIPSHGTRTSTLQRGARNRQRRRARNSGRQAFPRWTSAGAALAGTPQCPGPASCTRRDDLVVALTFRLRIPREAGPCAPPTC